MVATRFKKTQGGQTRRKEAHSGPLRARQGHKQGCWCLVSGRSPRDVQRWVSSTRKRLQLRGSGAAAQGQQKS